MASAAGIMANGPSDQPMPMAPASTPDRWARFRQGMLALLACAVLVLDFVFIPLHQADDEDHFAFAYATAHLRFGPAPPPDPKISSGTYVDAAIPAFVKANYHATRLGSPPARGPTAWTGRTVYYPVPASAYLPVIYLPQLLAIRAAEAAGGSVETTINAARIANGLSALALIGVALALLPETLGLFVLVVLSLPKTLLLFASNSADPMDHAIVLALLAFLYRAVQTGWRPRPWHYALAALGVLTVAGVRPPLAALGLLPFVVAWRQRSVAGMIWSLAGMAAALGWWAWMLSAFHDMRSPVTGTLAEKVVQFATLGPVMLAQTLLHRGVYYAATFVGELGYGDARNGFFYAIPVWAYVASAAMLALATTALGQRGFRLDKSWRWLLVLVAVAIVLGVFFSMSVSVTNLGTMVIEGVQGRYMVTPALLLATLAAGTMAPRDRAAALTRRALPLFLFFNAALMAGLGIELYWRW